MGLLNKLLGNEKKKKAPTKKKTTAATAKKKVPASVKDKYFITDLSADDKAATKANAKKKDVRMNIYEKVQQAIKNAELKKPESKLGRLEKIFTTNEEGKTIATIRYGSVIFYQGVMNDANVFDSHGKENFENKLGALNHLKIMLEADEWFNPQYEKYLATKELADKRSAATKKTNKKNAALATASSNVKSTAKKTAPKKTVATSKAKPATKKPATKKVASTKAKPAVKKAAPKKATTSKAKTAPKKATAKKATTSKAKTAAKKSTAKKPAAKKKTSTKKK